MSGFCSTRSVRLLSQLAVAEVVGEWESRVLCGISKRGRSEEGRSMKTRTARKQQKSHGKKVRLSNGGLPIRSQMARDRALHSLAAMRKDPNLSLTRAAKMHGVKQETIKKRAHR